MGCMVSYLGLGLGVSGFRVVGFGVHGFAFGFGAYRARNVLASTRILSAVCEL